MPTLFMFSLEKVNQCWHSATQQFIKRIDDDSEECSILKNWTKIVPALFTVWPSRVFQDFENTSSLSHARLAFFCAITPPFFYLTTFKCNWQAIWIDLRRSLKSYPIDCLLDLLHHWQRLKPCLSMTCYCYYESHLDLPYSLVFDHQPHRHFQR